MISNIQILIFAASATIALSGAPQLSLRLESNPPVREGDVVHLVCDAEACPHVADDEIIWKFNGKELPPRRPVYASRRENKLRIYSTQWYHAGNYSCSASNSEGTGESNTVHLRVLVIPHCKRGQPMVYPAAIGVPLKVECGVFADPDDVVFRWEFKDAETILGTRSSATLQLASNKTGALSSEVHYTPRSEQDYGRMRCFARNSVGEIREPCRFYILPAECFVNDVNTANTTLCRRFQDRKYFPQRIWKATQDGE